MPQQPPDEKPEGITIDHFNGLKNVISPEKLAPEDLARALNVDLDDAGQPRRRRGYRKVHPDPHHSLFTADDGTVYGVRSGSLGIIRPDTSFLSLMSGVADDPLIYTQVGPEIYFSSRALAGIIKTETDAIEAWGDPHDIWLSPVLNPTATLPAIRGRLLGAPPLATAHTYWNGRIYMAHGRLVWFTELYAYKFVDKTRNFWQFEGDITMLGTVTDGIYVGTTEGVWFISGTALEPKRVRVMDTAVIPGSMVYVPAELANPPQIPMSQDTDVKISILFLTDAGYCGGQDSGVCYNYSENKFIFPSANRAVATFRRIDGINQYLAVLDSDGDQLQNARFGDYVDAEVRRGGDAWKQINDGVMIGDTVEAVIV